MDFVKPKANFPDSKVIDLVSALVLNPFLGEPYTASYRFRNLSVSHLENRSKTSVSGYVSVKLVCSAESTIRMCLRTKF